MALKLRAVDGESSPAFDHLLICAHGGRIDLEVLKRTSGLLNQLIGLPPRLSSLILDLDDAYDEEKGQYNARTILKRVSEIAPPGCLRVIVLTEEDIFIPVFKYVFGAALLPGNCAVISLNRLRQEFYRSPPDLKLFYKRVDKTVLHELGHTFGLTHCRNRHCVMYSSTRIPDTDFKSSMFCHHCFNLLADLLGEMGLLCLKSRHDDEFPYI